MSHYDMDIPYRQWQQHLKTQPKQRYWLSSDQVFLKQHTRHILIEHAIAHHFTIKYLTLAHRTDWDTIAHTLSTQDLFNPKSFFLIDASSLKLDAKFAKQWLAQLDQTPTDHKLCLSTRKLTAAQKKTQWFSTMQAQQAHIAIWPLNEKDFIQWLNVQLNTYKISLHRDAYATFNMLSQMDPKTADDMLEKCTLIYGINQTLTAAHLIKAHSNTTPSSTFDILNATLNGHTKQAIEHLKSIQHYPATLMSLWGLFNATLKQLLEAHQRIQSGESSTTVIRNIIRNPQAQKPFAMTLHRLTQHQCRTLQKTLWQFELSIKGLSPLSAQHVLHQIILKLSIQE